MVPWILVSSKVKFLQLIKWDTSCVTLSTIEIYTAFGVNDSFLLHVSSLQTKLTEWLCKFNTRGKFLDLFPRQVFLRLIFARICESDTIPAKWSIWKSGFDQMESAQACNFASSASSDVYLWKPSLDDIALLKAQILYIWLWSRWVRLLYELRQRCK